MMTWALVVLGIFLFIGLVLVHEWGHFLAARRNDVEIEEFGLGFPPKARTITRKNGTEYTLNWLPLGGFVRLKGEHDADTEKGSFGAASLRAKIKIMTAGVGMNLLVAVLLLTFVALIGMPKLVDNQFTVASNAKTTQQKVLVGYVEPESPADTAGIKSQDQLVRIIAGNGQTFVIGSKADLPTLTKQFAGQTVKVEYVRAGQTKFATVKIRPLEEVEQSKNTTQPKAYLGVAPTEYTVQRYTWAAPVVAVGTSAQFTLLTLKGLGSAVAALFSGHAATASQNVAGPVGIFVILKDGSALGVQFTLMLIAIISLTLAIMNILPIPALDGGRLFVTLLYRGMKKPLSQRTEEAIHGTGFAVLMCLFVVITIVDVRRFL